MLCFKLLANHAANTVPTFRSGLAAFITCLPLFVEPLGQRQRPTAHKFAADRCPLFMSGFKLLAAMRSNRRLQHLVFKAMDWRRDFATAGNELLARIWINIHYWCASQKTTKFNSVANSFANCGNNAHCSSFLVNHP